MVEQHLPLMLIFLVQDFLDLWCPLDLEIRQCQTILGLLKKCFLFFRHSCFTRLLELILITCSSNNCSNRTWWTRWWCQSWHHCWISMGYLKQPPPLTVPIPALRQLWIQLLLQTLFQCSKQQCKAKIQPRQQVPMHNKLCLPQLNVKHQITTVVAVVVMMNNLKLIHSNIMWKRWC